MDGLERPALHHERNDGSKSAYRQERTRVGRFSLIISIVSLIISGITLYETVLKQPQPVMYAASNWRYTRLQAQGRDDELIVIPVSVANHGARPGVIRTFRLTLQKPDAQPAEFESAAILTPERTLQLFAPLTIAPHATSTVVLVFASRTAQGNRYVSGSGAYAARLVMCPVRDRSLGPIDDWLAPEPAGLEVQLDITGVSVKLDNNLFDDRQAGSVKVQEMTPVASDPC
jgi:hypothetical protein